MVYLDSEELLLMKFAACLMVSTVTSHIFSGNCSGMRMTATILQRLVWISSSHDSLTYQTNEVGFTLRDVESLCAVGCSSKAGQDEKIREKGIGFKSLFKIADVASIYSGVYFFKLDTRPPLGYAGMILPIYLDNANDFVGSTSIYSSKPTLMSLLYDNIFPL